MAKIFFLLLGEHETLPSSELKAILEAEGYPYMVSEQLDQVLKVDVDVGCMEAVKRRAAFTRFGALELFTCKAEVSQALKALNSTDLSHVLKRGESFEVRIKHVKDYARELDGMALEKKLGECILHKTEGTRVNLRSPEKTFTGILTEDKLVFGLKLAEIMPKSFMDRRPKKRPFFHPSAMQPKLARCMVNLAKPKAGDMVFDPFCGTGSILIEAALMGCRVLGLDVQRRMVKGSLRNFAHFGIKPEGLVMADARKPPIKAVDCIVADPPYGRSATTLKCTTKQIMEEALKAVYEMLDRGRRICMAAPKTIEIGSIGEDSGYKHLESHFVYVHRSLTREIAVLEKIN